MSQFTTAHATLSWRQEDNLLTAKWCGVVYSREFQQIAQTLLDKTQEHKLYKWYLHLEEMQEIESQDESWLFTEWLEAFLSLPIQKLALIPSQYLDNHMSIEQLIKVAQTMKPLDVQFFTEEQEALLWLNEKSVIDPLAFITQN
ncbi:STAS/SEC14 domain-containing protein [Nibribacter koreensis]|uniref:SpoIIAA-like n=1 Tax=Nibribacter koreensis TaxID=1084519 RepID=A0ABP8FZ58_9BACT